MAKRDDIISEVRNNYKRVDEWESLTRTFGKKDQRLE